MENMALIVFALFAIVIVSIVMVALTKKEKPDNKPIDEQQAKYSSKGTLLTPAELSFYKVLSPSLPLGLVVSPKVRISDILDVQKGLDRSRLQTARNKIHQKHVDFVLCNSENMSIVAVVELDDSSHKKDKVKVRDKFVNGAFRSAEIPMIRFKAKSKYDAQEIASTIEKSIGADVLNSLSVNSSKVLNAA